MDVVQNSERQTPLCEPNSKILKSKYYPYFNNHYCHDNM